jgi:hypothetical protein
VVGLDEHLLRYRAVNHGLSIMEPERSTKAGFGGSFYSAHHYLHHTAGRPVTNSAPGKWPFDLASQGVCGLLAGNCSSGRLNKRALPPCRSQSVSLLRRHRSPALFSCCMAREEAAWLLRACGMMRCLKGSSCQSSRMVGNGAYRQRDFSCKVKA